MKKYIFFTILLSSIAISTLANSKGDFKNLSNSKFIDYQQILRPFIPAPLAEKGDKTFDLNCTINTLEKDGQVEVDFFNYKEDSNHLLSLNKIYTIKKGVPFILNLKGGPINIDENSTVEFTNISPGVTTILTCS